MPCRPERYGPFSSRESGPRKQQHGFADFDLAPKERNQVDVDGFYI